MKSTSSFRYGAFVASAAIGFATLFNGCGKVAEEVAETAIESGMPGGGNVQIDSDSGTVSVQGSDGQGGAINVQAGESVALPADFPSDIPVPDGVTWNLVQNSQSDGKPVVMVQGMLATPLADVAASMKSRIESQGWTSVQNFQQAGEMEMLSYKKEERSLNVTITKADDQTSIMIASQ